MFSLPKLLVLAVIIAAVWYGFKMWGRGGRIRAEDSEPDRRIETESEPEDMSKCDVCGTFVPEDGARHCGRDGCPYPS
jgi:hypothetical protein